MKKWQTIQWKEEKLSVVIDYPDGIARKPLPVVVICHGFIGSKTGVNRLFVKAAEELVETQRIVVRFDYRGCGESTGCYGKNTLRSLIGQTQAVLAFVRSLDSVDPEQITLIGHSLGGAVATLTAANDPAIHQLVLWAAVGRPYDDLTQIVGAEKVNHPSKQTFDYEGYRFPTHFFHSMKEFSPLEAAVSVQADALVVHGEKDEEICSSYCCRYYEQFSRRPAYNVEQAYIPSGDHTFSSVESYRHVMDETLQWLSQSSYSHKTVATS